MLCEFTEHAPKVMLSIYSHEDYNTYSKQNISFECIKFQLNSKDSISHLITPSRYSLYFFDGDK